MNTTRSLILFLALALFGLVLLALPFSTARAADPVIVRVTTTGTTTWPCGQTDWSDPCTLQTALSHTLSGSELWVAAGTYTPTMGVTRTATFHLVEGVALYGGFAGGETLRSQRNYAENVAILSGDIGVPGDSSDNAYHVVTGSGVTNTAMLDGFTVRDGNANGSVPNDPSGRGGGMYNSNSSPTLTNVILSGNWADIGGGMSNWFDSRPTLSSVTFISNTALSSGGGMSNYWSSNPTLSSVTFMSNTANFVGGGMENMSSSPVLTNVTFISNTTNGGHGGGMISGQNSNPTLTNVTFSGNRAGDGGGMSSCCAPTLTNVTFSNNSGTFGGGGMYNYGNPTLTNVTFYSNTTVSAGGGMFNNGTPTLTNVTFVSNTASYGGGMNNYQSSLVLTNVTFSGNYAHISVGGINNISSTLAIRNTIVWGNWSSPQISNEGGTVSISDSVVQGSCPAGSTCTNIITADPRLGTLGYWGGPTQTIPLLPGSSAIDTGNDAVCPPTDQRGVPRPQGAHCDIGAFEAGFPLPKLALPLIRR